MENFFRYSRLFKILFTRICMIGINDNAGIDKTALCISLGEIQKVFIVVVWQRLPMFIHITSENGVRTRIALRMDFPSSVDKGVLVLRGGNGIHHNRNSSKDHLAALF